MELICIGAGSIKSDGEGLKKFPVEENYTQLVDYGVKNPVERNNFPIASGHMPNFTQDNAANNIP